MVPCKPNKVFQEKLWVKKEKGEGKPRKYQGRPASLRVKGNRWEMDGLGLKKCHKLLLSSSQGSAPDFMTHILKMMIPQTSV